MLSEDEKKVINYLNNKINENKKEIKNIESKNDTSLIGYGTLHDTYKLENWYYLILLNLIEKLQKENEEKDKQIDLMAEKIHFLGSDYDDFCIDTVWNEDCDKDCKECIKQYFEKLARKK